MSKFNRLKNRGGKYNNILLLTTAGAEGITVKEAQHMHILESSPRPNLISQAIGRVVRYKSHSLLKKKDRVVKVWRYWSLSTNEDSELDVKIFIKDKGDKLKTIPIGDTVDIELYKRGERETVEINSFLEFIKITKIENLKVEPNFKKLETKLLLIPPIDKLPEPPESLKYNIDDIKNGIDENSEININQIIKDAENDEKVLNNGEIIGEEDDDDDIEEIYDENELKEFTKDRLIAILELKPNKEDVSDFSKSRLIKMIKKYQDNI